MKSAEEDKAAGKSHVKLIVCPAAKRDALSLADTDQGRDLMSAFSQINDRLIRQAIIDFVRDVARDGDQARIEA